MKGDTPIGSGAVIAGLVAAVATVVLLRVLVTDPEPRISHPSAPVGGNVAGRALVDPLPGPGTLPARRPAGTTAAHEAVHVAAPGRRLPRDARQPETGRIVFVARNFHDTPLSGVLVALRSEPVDEFGDERQAFTAGNGELAFDPLQAGRYAYWLAAPGQPELQARAWLDLAAGEEKIVPLRLGDHDRTIRGRALDQDGAPVAGLEIQARPYRVPSVRDVLVPRSQEAWRARSGAGGDFEIAGLGEGEYLLYSAADARYLPSEAIVRADVDAALLSVVERRTLRVFGQVRRANGDPLPGARVRYLGPAGRGAFSDEQGWYEFSMEDGALARDRRFRFLASGHRPGYVSTRAAAWRGRDELRLDATLEPVAKSVELHGYVLDEKWRPVEGALVHLGSTSLGTHYLAVSSAHGSASFPRVVTGDDYRLWIPSRGRYRSHPHRRLEVNAGTPPFELVLESQSFASLTGRMVDVTGSPVGQFSLWLQSAKSHDEWFKVTSDADGYFEQDGVPAGPVTLLTASLPQFRVSGITLNAGDANHYEVVLDWGTEHLGGQILGIDGAPLAGAEVQLHWQHHGATMRSTSVRKTRTDHRGTFNFSQLGPGAHRLSASAAGHRKQQLRVEAGDVRVALRLEPLDD